MAFAASPFLFLLLLVQLAVLGSDALSLRWHSRASFSAIIQNATAKKPNFEVPHDACLRVIEETEPKQTVVSECLCGNGTFWHWHVKQCVEQGALGYECGWFPEKVRNRVCQDGLKCQPLEGAADNYESHGMYRGQSKSIPATCVPCKPEDNCKVGQERHDEECSQEYTLTGEACTTVRVTFPEKEVEVSEKTTVKVNATATANATANATATVTQKSTHEATAEEKVTEEADATATVHENTSAEATASASATATSTGQGSSTENATATVTVEANATESHTAEVNDKVTGQVKATQKTEKVVSEEKACVSVEAGKKLAKVTSDQRIGAALAANIVTAMKNKAFEISSGRAIKKAIEKGVLSEKAAEELAMQKAGEKLAGNAQANADEKAAQEAETKAQEEANDEAQEKADALANKQAQAEAEAEAEEKANAGAETEAAANASAKAQQDAEKKAQDEAKAKANQKAENAATTVPVKMEPVEPAKVPVTPEKRKVPAADTANTLP